MSDTEERVDAEKVEEKEEKGKEEEVEKAEEKEEKEGEAKEYAVLAKDKWVPDSDAPKCQACETDFTLLNRKHHCRVCGKVFCGDCCSQHVQFPGFSAPERACIGCCSKLYLGAFKAPHEHEGEGVKIDKPTGEFNFHHKIIKSDSGDAVSASKAASLNFKECYIEAEKAAGVNKSGAGTIVLDRCYVKAKEGLTFSGSCKVHIKDSFVHATEVGIRSKGSSVITLENSLIIVPSGWAMIGSGTLKFDFTNSFVHGKNGLQGKGSGELILRGGSLSSNAPAHPLMVKIPLPQFQNITLELKGSMKVKTGDGAKIIGTQKLSSGIKIEAEKTK